MCLACQRDGRHQVHGVDIGRIQDRLQVATAPRDTVFVAGRVQNALIRVADRQTGDVRMVQIDWDELGAESQSNQRNVYLFVHFFLLDRAIYEIVASASCVTSSIRLASASYCVCNASQAAGGYNTCFTFSGNSGGASLNFRTKSKFWPSPT